MRASKIVTAVGAVLCGLALWGCGPSSSPPPATEAATPPKPQRFDIDFGKEIDWAGGSSDYATSTPPSAVVFENRALPEGFTGSGLYSAGTNHSDDLFLFAKKKLQGLKPSVPYEVSFQLTFLTDAAAGCVGVGGSPGESVSVKGGATTIEPVAVETNGEITMNIDKGVQSNDGPNALVLGNLAGANRDCQNRKWETKTVSRKETIKATTTSAGELWLLFGIDSGFEAGSSIYYQSAVVIAKQK